jgi:hypothetical protein
MTKDINDFVYFDRLKNGKIKISSDIHKEANIYQYLRGLGFCKSKLGNKRVYYRREGETIKPSSLHDIKYTFWELLQKGDFSNIPTDIEYSEILNWYLDKQPIKENGLFDYYLEDKLTETEADNFCLQTNHSFRHTFEVQQLISKFDEWNFSKTTDTVGAFCKDNPLFYKKIGDKKYLVFNHYNSKSKTNDGFDCWIATFANEKQIGIKKTMDVQEIRLSFHLDRDFELIKDYLN